LNSEKWARGTKYLEMLTWSNLWNREATAILLRMMTLLRMEPICQEDQMMAMEQEKAKRVSMSLRIL